MFQTTSFSNNSSKHPIKPPRRNHFNREDRGGSQESKSSEKSDENIQTSHINHFDNNIKQHKSKKDEDLMNNPLVAHFLKQHSVDETTRGAEKGIENEIN